MIIDKIYAINLKSRTDKLINIDKFVNEYIVLKDKYELYEAVVGNNISDEEIRNILSISSLNNLYNLSNHHNEIRTKGAIGCYLSHYNIWKLMIDNNYNNILIIEDDIYCYIDKKEFNEYINSIPEDYDIALLSWFPIWFDKLDNPKKKTKINGYWNKYNSINVFGTSGYLVSRKGAKKLIKNAFPICFQVDSYINILNYIDKSFVRYIAEESIIKQYKFGSDIQIYCKNCDITQEINDMYNKKYNIETFDMLNNNNNNNNNNLIFIIIIIIVIIFIKNKY
jgi:GR25 family glycosyltransferase involved in LPS biosynthesis